MSQMHNTTTDLAFDMIDRLHKSMRLSGKSAVALSVDLGVHRNTVNNYLSGRSPLDRRTLVAWAVATGVPILWLETGQTPDDGGDGGPGGETVGAKVTVAKPTFGRRWHMPDTIAA